MPARESARVSNILLWSLLVAALLAHAWWVTRNWTSPFLIGHEFRQTQTALNSYYIDRDNDFSLLYETPILGKPWISVLMEVPIYEWSVVGLSRWSGQPHYVCARAITLACFYLALPAFYLLLGRLGLPPARRAPALAFTLLCPVYIFYSRSFLMDSMALLGSAWFLFGYVRMMDERRWPWFLLATAAGSLAALVKSATLAIWLWPAAAFVVWQLWCEWRDRAGWGRLGITVFWGVAGVTVPLGLLRLWILLTDPIKAGHDSAWIFTADNLARGNWGLRDVGSRLSPQLWTTLAERWHEAIMVPLLLVGLLVAGLFFLPKVRGPALGLAGVFFWAQLLFPYAYAYQDYYFYSCAVFLTAGLGFLAVGMIDSKLPRWLVIVLMAMPLVGEGMAYHRYYLPQQRTISEGGFSYTKAIRDFLPQGSVIVVAGADWSSIIPYYTRRRSLMLRHGLENDGDYLQRAFAKLWDEDVAALVLVFDQRNNHALINRAAEAFGLDTVPTYQNHLAQVYCSLRYRDNLRKSVEAAGHLGDLELPPVEPIKSKMSEPLNIFSPVTAGSYLGVSPAPLRAYFQFGLGYMWLDKQEVIFAHPKCDIWLHPASTATRITWEFGMVPDAYQREGGKTDGVVLSVTSLAGGQERTIYQRVLDPVNRPADRGTIRVEIPYRPRPGEILRFSNHPNNNDAFDWTYWKKIEVR